MVKMFKTLYIYFIAIAKSCPEDVGKIQNKMLTEMFFSKSLGGAVIDM